VSNRGRSEPTTVSSMPPAGGPTPDESTIEGSTPAGMFSTSSVRSSQALASLRTSPVTPALVRSVMWASPPVSCHTNQLSTVPKHRSRWRSGSYVSSRNASLVADTDGDNRTPWSRSMRQVPAVRRSCQPMPGATGSPVARSQTMVDDRWLVTPTASAGPPSARAARATSNAAVARADASNSTKPGTGDDGSTSRWCTWSTVASGRTIAARTPLVPASTTRMLTT
jgi:hypothetical protein